MSEILATNHNIVERLSSQNHLRFGSVPWSSDGYECPSCIPSFRHRTQIVIQPQKSRSSAHRSPLEQPVSGSTKQSGWRESNSHPKLGKLMCCHYTTAAKNKNRQPFPVYSAFGDIAIDSIQLHRFALTFIPKWQQVATDRSWQQNSIAATSTSHMPVVSSTLKQPDKIHAWLHRGSATSAATTFSPLGTAMCWSSGSQSTRHHRATTRHGFRGHQETA